MALGKPGEYERAVWSLFGFLARYGHQSIAQLMEFPMSDLQKLARSVGEFMEEENAQVEGE